MYTETKPRTDSSVSTISETILLENKLPFNPKYKTGPTIDLFFHELASENEISQKYLRYSAGFVLGVLFLFTFPLIAVLIKILTKESVLKKTKVTGKRGILFQQYTYPTNSTNNKSSFFLKVLLGKSGLYKLPSVINIWKGQMNLVGPYPYPAEWSKNWNKQFSDFYKRFASRPGYISIATPSTDPRDLEAVEQCLRKELSYIATSSLRKDLKHLFRLS